MRECVTRVLCSRVGFGSEIDVKSQEKSRRRMAAVNRCAASDGALRARVHRTRVMIARCDAERDGGGGIYV